MSSEIQRNTPRSKSLSEKALQPANDNRGVTTQHTKITASNVTANYSNMHIGPHISIKTRDTPYEWEDRLRSWLKKASSPKDFDHLDDMLGSLKKEFGYGDVQPRRKSSLSIRNRSPLKEKSRQNSRTNDNVEDAQLSELASGMTIHNGSEPLQSSTPASNTPTGLKTPVNTPRIFTGQHSGQQSDWIMKLEREIIDEKKIREAECIRQWLGPPQSPDLYERTLRMKVHNTCNWILTTPTFLQWASPDFTSDNAKTLWIYSLSGFGKTFLCARIIEHLKASFDTPVGYFFLSSKNESYRDPFIAMHTWLLKILQHNSVIRAMRQVWESQSKETISQSIIIKLFRTVVQQVPGCTFVLDGLDECGSASTTDGQAGDEIIQDFLTELGKAVHQTKTRILLVSQDDQTIRSNIPNNDMVLSEHRITPEDVDADILLYAQSILERKITKETNQNKETMAELMRDRCCGQFEWLRAIQRSLPQQPTLRQLQEAIAEAPRGLDKLYERNWKRIFAFRDETVARAIDTLRWVAFSLRPLTVLEIANALMIDLKAPETSIKNVPGKIDEAFISELEDICAGLLEVHSHENDEVAKWTVHLQHHSVKEFLLQATISNEETRCERVTEISSRVDTENAKLARLCLHYLNYKSTWEDSSAIVKADLIPITQAFRTYASTYWHQHLRGMEKDNERSVKLINHFFDMWNSAWDAWESWSSANMQILENEDELPNGNQLHYACKLGLLATVRYVLEQQTNILETRTPSGRTSLWIACAEGHDDIVEVLLTANADATARAKNDYTPLEIAAENGHAGVIEVFLNTKATVDPDDECLCLASRSGQYEAVSALLRHGIDMSTRTKDGWTALQLAIFNDYLDIAHLLIDNGADVSAVDESGSTPLHTAADEDDFKTAKLLLLNNANVNAIDNEGRTPLHIASMHGFIAMIKILIKEGAPINAQCKGGRTPLYYAVRERRSHAVSLLLEKRANSSIAKYTDAVAPIHIATRDDDRLIMQILLNCKATDVNICTTKGRTALIMASARGEGYIVKQLLEHGADPSKADSFADAPLHFAARYGHIGIAQSLINYGANKNAIDINNYSPLSIALEYSQRGFIRMLFDSGDDIVFKDSEYCRALLIAIANGNTGIVRNLIHLGADLSVTDTGGKTLLELAIYYGWVEIAGLLVEHGADVNAVDVIGWTLLHYAANHQDIEMMRFLIEHGGKINATDGDGWTPVYTCIAAETASLEAVSFLLSRKADINISDDRGLMPVQVAIESGDVDMVSSLLKAGAKVNTFTVDGRSSILLSSPDGSVELLQLLFHHGADASQPDIEGSTPLMIAAKCGNWRAVKWLLKVAPSTVGELDRLQRSAFFYGAATGRVAISKILFTADSNMLAIKDFTGITALERAARQGHNIVIRNIATLASAAHISVSIPELTSHDIRPVPYDPDKSTCDICIQDISVASIYYECPICMNGDFIMCEQCHGHKEKCLDPAHDLEVVKPEIN